MKAYGLTFFEATPLELVHAVRDMFNYINSGFEFAEQDLSLLSQWSKALIKSGYPLVPENHSQPCISFLQNHQAELF